ncbi:amino acid ABC transporter permease [Clostridia bacterium]|nr:amino acid ABC transporter permease [Clostridia bacterium]
MLNSGYDVLLSINNLRRLMQGILVTLQIAVVSVIVSVFLGMIYGLIMTTKNRFIYGLCRAYLEAFRIIPILVWLFLLFFGGAYAFGTDLDGKLVSIIVFTMWGTAEMGDIVRGTVQSIPRHQWQSGEALGLTRNQLHRYVIIPQAVRRYVPAAINLVTRMIKTTSLVSFVGVSEVLRVGKQIIEFNMMKNPMAAFWIYAFIFFVYFLLCFPISKFSKRLETRWA